MAFGRSLGKFMLGKDKKEGVRSGLRSLPSFPSGEEFLWSTGELVSEDPAVGQVQRGGRGHAGHGTFLLLCTWGLKKKQTFSDFSLCSPIESCIFFSNLFCRFILVALLKKPKTGVLFLNIERNSFTQQIV